jgi:exosortase C (VPDSG-CTERM-specific)
MNAARTEKPEQMPVSTEKRNPARLPGRASPILLFGAAALSLHVLFSAPLLNWFRFAISKDRNSYLLLVPIISVYLIGTQRRTLQTPFQRSSTLAIIPAAIGAISMLFLGSVVAPVDRLSLQIFALLNFLLALAFFFIGNPILRRLAFPVAFLIFAVPVPTAVGDAIEMFLQYTSAEAAYWLMSVVGIPMIRDGVNFRLPNLFIQVAQECSGYNSTFALFMVSLIAGYLFLKFPSKRAVLTLAVIPLAIFRNGFRITTLATLCVYDDPAWIDSNLHHKGGPIFFALSLIPFFILLWGLRRSEIAKDRTVKVP